MHFPYNLKMFLIYAFDFFGGVNGIIVIVTAFGFSKSRGLRRFFSFLLPINKFIVASFNHIAKDYLLTVEMVHLIQLLL